MVAGGAQGGAAVELAWRKVVGNARARAEELANKGSTTVVVSGRAREECPAAVFPESQTRSVARCSSRAKSLTSPPYIPKMASSSLDKS